MSCEDSSKVQVNKQEPTPPPDPIIATKTTTEEPELPSTIIIKKEEQRPSTLIDLLQRNTKLNLTDTCPISLLQIQSNSRSYTIVIQIKANCPLRKQ
jgi:hypothetical protein